MKRLIYQVAVGPPCKLYEFCTASVADYATAHGITHIVQREPILRIKPDPATSGRSAQAVDRLGYLPIFEKENALAYLGEFDQVAVIDADVWVRPGSPNIFDETEAQADFAGVVERDMPLTKAYERKVQNHSKAQFGELISVEWDWNQWGANYFNCGVMVMNASLSSFLHGQTPKEFLHRPEFKWFVDGVGALKWSTDQTLLNWWLRDVHAHTRELPWWWNTLYGAVEPQWLDQANFVHFFLRDHLPNKGEDVAELVKTL